MGEGNGEGKEDNKEIVMSKGKVKVGSPLDLP